MKKKRVITLLISLILLISMGAPTAYANSAQTQWEGVDTTGAIVREKDSPVVVEHETLTFDIQQFPKSHYSDISDYLAYTGRVTAEYTFYNPADYTVTATLVFPFGAIPDYGHIWDSETGEAHQNSDTEKYDITVDGTTIDRTLRHTLTSWGQQFELETDLALLHDDYVEDAFYKLDLPVTKYVFLPSGVDTNTYEAADAGFDMLSDDPDRRIYYVDQNGLHTQDDGDLRVHSGARNGEAITVYVIGKDYAAFPEWKFYQDGGVEDDEEIEGAMTLESREELSFRDLALSKWSEASGVSEVDWYNAIVSMLTGSSDSTGSNLHLWEYGSLDIRNFLMRWYEYEITLEPGKRIVNTVTAPIYPSINSNWEPPIYEYTYLLSPAQTWAEFGTLDIVINTPYYMIQSGPEGFEWQNPGYTAHLDDLPEGELEFTLCESETPEDNSRNVAGYIILGLFLNIAPVLILVLLIGGGVFLFIRYRKRKGGK